MHIILILLSHLLQKMMAADSITLAEGKRKKWKSDIQYNHMKRMGQFLQVVKDICK